MVINDSQINDQKANQLDSNRHNQQGDDCKMNLQ